MAKASEDPLAKRRKLDKDEVKVLRTTMEATCPLFHMAYEDQLKHKNQAIDAIIQEFLKELSEGGNRNNANKEAVEKFTYMDICASPQTIGYRNKNEFAVGKNAQGETTIGFRVGSYVDGSVEVSSDIEQLPQLTPAAIWAVQTFREFLAKTRFEPFNPDGCTGHIRQFVVRTSEHTKAVMITVGIYSTNLNESELLQLKNDIKEHYIKLRSSVGGEGGGEASDDYNVASLYYQDMKNREKGQQVLPVEHLAFETHITDKIRDLQFRISPLAFFQVNNGATEILFQRIIDFADINAQSLVLDICCGTGTIGLCVAKSCRFVVGVDNNEDAIKDAEYNAEKNNIKNCKFYTGNAEKYIELMCNYLQRTISRSELTNIVAIIDPPRAGLRKLFINHQTIAINCKYHLMFQIGFF